MNLLGLTAKILDVDNDDDDGDGIACSPRLLCGPLLD